MGINKDAMRDKGVGLSALAPSRGLGRRHRRGGRGGGSVGWQVIEARDTELLAQVLEGTLLLMHLHGRGHDTHVEGEGVQVVL